MTTNVGLDADRPLRRWDLLVGVGVAYMCVVGLALTLAPGVMRQVFDVMVFGTDGPAVTGRPAEDFLEFAYAILGAAILGWSVLLVAALRGPLARRSRRAWWAVTTSVSVWFVPDTVRSLLTHPENAVFNLTFAVPIAVGLAGMRGELRDEVHVEQVSVASDARG
ncbi:MAG: hypothetical protein ACRCSN_08325 [Dermatophilaceae bacterium]